MFDVRENLKNLPDAPGVYMHKDKLGQVIYVGKAISLKNRVRQYFQSAGRKDAKFRAMTAQIAEFEYITTRSEMEALILENTLIKKHMPRYNVLLRDDKTYPYIKVTMGEAFPRLVKTRKIEKDGGKYFGPYADAGAVDLTVELLSAIYQLKGCAAKHFPRGHKPCLHFHIRHCRGVCTGTAPEEAYKGDIARVIDFLSGKRSGILEDLKKNMLAASAEMDFENAARYRDYIEAVHAVGEKQRVVILGAKDMDIVLVVPGEKRRHIALFTARGGKLSGRETFSLQTQGEEVPAEIAAAFVKQYYAEAALIPKEILVAEKLPDSALTAAWLSDLAGYAVKITAPQRGDKKAMLALALKDAAEMAKTIEERARAQQVRGRAIQDALTALLHQGAAAGGPTTDPPPTGDEAAPTRHCEQAQLAKQPRNSATPSAPAQSGDIQPGSTPPTGDEAAPARHCEQAQLAKQPSNSAPAQPSGAPAPPRPRTPNSEFPIPSPYRIEAYDISNTNGADTVGAMVVFEGTAPKKKAYRKFKVRTVESADDTGSLREILYRRFKRAAGDDPGFAQMPDLILIDGGKNQVAAVEQTLAAMRLSIPVLGMRKDNHHRTEALIYNGMEFPLQDWPLLFGYIGTIQEEVHRFAIEYHRGLRNRKALQSALDEIEGVGPTRRNALLAHFGGIEGIKRAQIQELRTVKGITEKVAHNIKAFFS